jgi:subtilase family serine protease
LSGQPDVVVGGSAPSFGPSDLQTFYNETPLLTAGNSGKGDCIAVIGDSDFLDAAISLFNTQFSLPPSAITRVLADTTSPGINGDEFEALWDQEWVHATAPGAPISFYLGNDSKATVDAVSDAIKRAIDDNACSVINISFGFCGKASAFYTGFLDPLFAKAAAQGQSIFVAQGDAGAADVVQDPKTFSCVTATTPHVNEMGADPNVTSVGGTMFTPKYDASGNDVGFVTEHVWNDASGAGAGGRALCLPSPPISPASRRRTANAMFPISAPAPAERLRDFLLPTIRRARR